MTKPKPLWDFYYSGGRIEPSNGAKILRLVADEVEKSGVKFLGIRIIVQEPPRPTRKASTKKY